MTFFRNEKHQGGSKRLFGKGRSEPRLSRKLSGEALRGEGAPEPAAMEPLDQTGADIFDFSAGARPPAEPAAEERQRSRVRPVRVRRMKHPVSEMPGMENGSEAEAPAEEAQENLQEDWADNPFAARNRVSEPAPRRTVRRKIWDAEPEDDDTGEAESLWGASAPTAGPLEGGQTGDDMLGDLDALGDDDAIGQDPFAGQGQDRRAEDRPRSKASDLDDEVAFARSQLARLKGVGADANAGAAAEPAARARTRVLGFGAMDPGTANPFAAQQDAAPEAAQGFTVGWLVIVEGPGRGRSFTLAQGVATIGRGEDQVVRLDFGDTAISRSAHASVVYDEESNCYYLGAGTKSNVVRRNGRPVLATEEMENGDQIRLGETTLRFVALCDDAFSWGQETDETLADA